MQTFGASAPLKELQKKFGFEPDQVVAVAKKLLADMALRHPLEIRAGKASAPFLGDLSESDLQNCKSFMKQTRVLKSLAELSSEVIGPEPDRPAPAGSKPRSAEPRA